MASPHVVYVAAQRLFVKRGDDEPLSVESKFVASVRDRAASQKRKNAWREQGMGAAFQGRMLWGMDGDDALGVGNLARITGLSRGSAPGEVLYTIDTGKVSALCAMDALAPTPDDTERRVFHSADDRVARPSSVKDGYLLCDMPTDAGSTNLTVLLDDGSDTTVLTGGDSADAAASWVPGEDRQLVFHSAGVGRDAAGAFMGLGPSEIQRLDIPSGELATVASDPKHDFLAPRVDAEGTLYCIRRPYRSPQEPPSTWRAILDFLLFPFRILAAIFGWLNFFTARYTGKPLTTAGTASKKAADARQLMIWGNLVDASRAAEEAPDDDDGLVPRSWELVRFVGDGPADTIARGVITYDLDGEGGVVFSNGRALHHVSASGTKTKLVDAEGVTHLVVLPA
ncbi:MAG: hypothetical protein KC731_33320 [Myxococcales bacterium]|nr:hypothetical protein [Myxococcales bacterium]